MTDIRDTLVERGGRYGRFSDNATISNAVLNILRATAGWSRFQPDQIVATEIIVQKLARALSGDPNYDDNWRDIAGYAQLIVDRINGTGTYAEPVTNLVTLGDTNALSGHIYKPDDPRLFCTSCGARLGHAHVTDCPALRRKNASNPG